MQMDCKARTHIDFELKLGKVTFPKSLALTGIYFFSQDLIPHHI